MKSNLSLDLTDEARRDFRAILRYTRKLWGDHQRNRYAAQLDDELNRLTLFPLLGEARDELALGMRSRVVAEHVIYYRIDAETITVRRILHQSMEAKTHVKN